MKTPITIISIDKIINTFIIFKLYHKFLGTLTSTIWAQWETSFGLLVVLKRWYIQVKRRKVWDTGQQKAPSYIKLLKINGKKIDNYSFKRDVIFCKKNLLNKIYFKNY